MKMFDIFNDQSSKEQGIHCFTFKKEDIVRSGILRYIIDKVEASTQHSGPPESMFPHKPN